MRIYSKFKDYYDNVCRYDQEKIPVFERKTEIINKPDYKDSIEQKTFYEAIDKAFNSEYVQPHWYSATGYRLGGYHWDWFEVAFCGKVYFGWTSLSKTFHGKDKVLQGPNLHNHLSYDAIDPNNEGYRMYLAAGQPTIEFPVEIHRMVNSPIILHQPNSIVINPNLQDIAFFKKIDPYTAYQEIDYYLSNEMVIDASKSIQRTNEEIRDSHGMDKWSFKKR